MNNEELHRVIQNLQTRVEILEKRKEWEAKMEQHKLIFSSWQKMVDTQMHFNEMSMRVRNLATTMLLAVFGAAAYSLQYQTKPFFITMPLLNPIFGERHLHVAFFIITFGMMAWLFLGLLDVGHFHYQLVGAVTKGMELEKKYSDDPLLRDVLGMTTSITTCSRRLFGLEHLFGGEIKARSKILSFYILIVLLSCVLAWGASTLTIPAEKSPPPKSGLEVVPDTKPKHEIFSSRVPPNQVTRVGDKNDGRS